MSENDKLDKAIMEVLGNEAHTQHSLRMELRRRLNTSEAPYIDRRLRVLRERGLVYFRGGTWHAGKLQICPTCTGTGVINKKETAREEREYEGEEEQELAPSEEVAHPARVTEGD